MSFLDTRHKQVKNPTITIQTTWHIALGDNHEYIDIVSESFDIYNIQLLLLEGMRSGEVKADRYCSTYKCAYIQVKSLLLKGEKKRIHGSKQ
jgi:hypothetical protein